MKDFDVIVERTFTRRRFFRTRAENDLEAADKVDRLVQANAIDFNDYDECDDDTVVKSVEVTKDDNPRFKRLRDTNEKD